MDLKLPTVQLGGLWRTDGVFLVHCGLFADWLIRNAEERLFSNADLAVSLQKIGVLDRLFKVRLVFVLPDSSYVLLSGSRKTVERRLEEALIWTVLEA